MGKNQVLFLSQMEESKMAKQVHIRVDDDIYKELSDYSVVRAVHAGLPVCSN